ncbi:hypothetical protein PR048_026082 [Dryococelus australis]|uniref:Uncharacterized protein n=1 Tax=Dryococelus australis TaxID=614101 RepID=A0ABQ9GKC1_9NEOP|nr:hypothetical protein PR048_026082 [Dryococelus australis]
MIPIDHAADWHLIGERNFDMLLANYVILLVFAARANRAIPGRATGFSHVRIVPDDAAGRRVFSGISRFPSLTFRRCSILTPLHPHRPGHPNIPPPPKFPKFQRAHVLDVLTCPGIFPRNLQEPYQRGKQPTSKWLRLDHTEASAKFSNPCNTVNKRGLSEVSENKMAKGCSGRDYHGKTRAGSKINRPAHSASPAIGYAAQVVCRRRYAIRGLAPLLNYPAVYTFPRPRKTLSPSRRSEVSMEQRRNARAEETGDPREKPTACGIVHHDSQMQKSGSVPIGYRIGLSRWCRGGGVRVCGTEDWFRKVEQLQRVMNSCFGGCESGAEQLRYLASYCAKNSRLSTSDEPNSQATTRHISTAFLLQGKQSFCLRPPVLHFPLDSELIPMNGGLWLNVSSKTESIQTETEAPTISTAEGSSIRLELFPKTMENLNQDCRTGNRIWVLPDAIPTAKIELDCMRPITLRSRDRHPTFSISKKTTTTALGKFRPTRSEGSSAHSTFSSPMKHAGDLFVPRQIIPVLCLARNVQPYLVTMMDYSDFMAYTDIRMTRELSLSMEQVPECKGRGSGRSPGKPADQQNRPVRFPHATPPGIELGSPGWNACAVTTTPPGLVSLREEDTNQEGIQWTEMTELMVTKSHPEKIFFKIKLHLARELSALLVEAMKQLVTEKESALELVRFEASKAQNSCRQEEPLIIATTSAEFVPAGQLTDESRSPFVAPRPPQQLEACVQLPTRARARGGAPNLPAAQA